MLKLFLTVLTLCLTLRSFAAPAIEARDAWSDQVLSAHNAARAHYGARPLTWNSNLYASALQWAQQCKFQHSTPSGYGENLEAVTGSSGTISAAVGSWMSEAAKYNYNNPVFSTNTGHFTQVVWKSTTQVACAKASCAAGTIFSQASTFIVCRYTPPGNVAGNFASQVGRPV